MSEKWFRYFKHIFIGLQLEFGKSLGSSICTTKNFEWLGIQLAVENKDIFWNSIFSRWASTKSTEKIQRNRTKEDVNYTWIIATKWQKRTMPPNQLNNVNHVISVFVGNIQCGFALVAYNEIFFYISYSFCLAFCLCSGLIVFNTSLEVIKLAFFESKSGYVCWIFANFIFTFETKS